MRIVGSVPRSASLYAHDLLVRRNAATSATVQSVPSSAPVVQGAGAGGVTTSAPNRLSWTARRSRASASWRALVAAFCTAAIPSGSAAICAFGVFEDTDAASGRTCSRRGLIYSASSYRQGRQPPLPPQDCTLLSQVAVGGFTQQATPSLLHDESTLQDRTQVRFPQESFQQS